MTTYVIGDVQGCYKALKGLLAKLDFDQQSDQLWFAGDLVNRGPDSLSCLRFIKSLGASARMVLGNHDLHLLAIYYGGCPAKRKDTLDAVLQAPDCADLLQWLKQQPLMIWDKRRDVVLTHAGLPHIWSMQQAYLLSLEVTAMLQSERCAEFFRAMYGNQPEGWSASLSGMERLRVITNYFTRMRFIDQEGILNLTNKDEAKSAPSGFLPWFGVPRPDRTKVLFGHWAMLNGVTGQAQFEALDTGCVWGGALTALNLDTNERSFWKCAAPPAIAT